MSEEYSGQSPDPRNPQANDGTISPRTLGMMPNTPSLPQGGPEIQIGPGSAQWSKGTAEALAGKSVPVGGVGKKGKQ
jgi:hypothetical protein